jgi:hypothetical protein
MVVNKDPEASQTARINLIGFRPITMAAYERTGADKVITALAIQPAPVFYTFPPYSQTLLVFQGSTASGIVDWWIDQDALMMVVGKHATVHVQTASKVGEVEITSIEAQPGIKMNARLAHFSVGHPAAIDIAAGADPGFYSFTITGKTSTGHIETQSGWIVVGSPGSLPGRS